MIHIWNVAKEYEHFNFSDTAMFREPSALSYCGEWVVKAAGNLSCDENGNTVFETDYSPSDYPQPDCEACILMHFAEKAEETNGLSSVKN